MWGLETLIDLKHCNPLIIRSADKLKEYAQTLVDLIKMKSYGEPQVIHFGSCPKVEGFTLIQPIETSLISGHFVNSTNMAFINIFSCKDYNSKDAALFTANFFGAKQMDFCGMVRGGELLS